ncbi:hypothetical protein SeMB42_g07505 [Synchytrium endobioticum]|uniref:protein-serine/threonine phosphatase n=1 Tax=Synchytrium endobioticum TaxID=286115 RepID=A0A507BWT3_9FUNG|nr:hypothetical protein SeMB42_g07505 [Synchytrium endobioticum]TPX39119.1 hypothetical protein SeLEV6574_g07419 [Synchytrium endobioticum]
MGQTLSEPVTEKHTTSGSDDRYAYATSEMQGWRISMEDAHTTILRLSPPTQPRATTTHPPVAFFAVYDGHGGSAVARYAGSQLHKRIASDPAYAKGDYAKAIISGYLGVDVDLKADVNFAYDSSGCTAVCSIITDDGKLIVGNAGDSRAVLSSNGRAQPLSSDHKPVNPEEWDRIDAAGGFVQFGRVNGSLALSRALGDFDFKTGQNLPPEEQIVTAYPDVTIHQMTDEDEFLVLACDGIWDCMSNQDVVDFIRIRIATSRGNLESICEALMDHCLAPKSELGGVGCDNMTVVIVGLLRGQTLPDWASNIRTKIETSTNMSAEEIEKANAMKMTENGSPSKSGAE